MIKVGVVGGTGYTGVELLRLLVLHPMVSLHAVTSRSEVGVRVDETFPSLRGRCDLTFVEPTIEFLAECDLVFFATPNGTAMKSAPELLSRGVKIIDLAADFRLKKLSDWAHWYGEPHACPEILEEAVYGLPEVNREQIKTARIVGNPGCYPTATQLGFLPLIENNLIDVNTLIADVKSGVSGGGRGAKVSMLCSEASENFSAYAVPGHRHLPEVKQGLSKAAGQDVNLTFVPHLTPMVRGIHATLYAKLAKSDTDVQSVFEQRFKDEPYVDVMPAGAHPQTKSVRGANLCRLAVHIPQGGDTVVVLSVIDNLVKGAAGQAVQNMNIMFGYEETQGLEIVPLAP